MDSRKVTVLIPTYNRRVFLLEALKSIFIQSHKNWQIIIYDDSSTDNTKDDVFALMQLGIPIKYVCSKENNGASFARNRLLDLCDTEIACWQDSDDYSNKYRLEYQLKHLPENQLVFSAFGTVTSKPTLIEETPKIIKGNFAHASGMFIIDKTIRFDETLRIAEDNDWRLHMTQKYNVLFLHDVLYYIRFHNDRLGVNKGIKK